MIITYIFFNRIFHFKPFTKSGFMLPFLFSVVYYKGYYRINLFCISFYIVHLFSASFMLFSSWLTFSAILFCKLSSVRSSIIRKNPKDHVFIRNVLVLNTNQRYNYSFAFPKFYYIPILISVSIVISFILTPTLHIK